MRIDKWLHRYLRLAREVSTWSKDPSTQVGAITVGHRGQILSQGFNGFPRCIHDSDHRLNNRATKYRYMIHGEANCIYNAILNGVSLIDSTMYVYARVPVCTECSKAIVQVGVKRVFACHSDEVPEPWRESGRLAMEIFSEAGVSYDAVFISDLDNWDQSVEQARDKERFESAPTLGVDRQNETGDLFVHQLRANSREGLNQ